MKLFFISVALLFITSCAGLNPNVGERSADMYWTEGNYEKQLEIVRPNAEAGYPWAQLRLAIAFHNGDGATQNYEKALDLYHKVAKCHGNDAWSKGISTSAGKSGYYNQNSDALMAQFNIAKIYYEGTGVSKDLETAYLYIRNVEKESKGEPIYFCCSFAGGLFITTELVQDLKNKIANSMTNEQKNTAEAKLKSWSPYDKAEGV